MPVIIIVAVVCYIQCKIMKKGDKSGVPRSMSGGKDWLASQMRDERRAMSDMFGSEAARIAQEHSSVCDAELLRQYHWEECGAEQVMTETQRFAHKEAKSAKTPESKPVSKLTKAEIQARKQELIRRREARNNK